VTGVQTCALPIFKKHRPRYNIILRDDKQYALFRLGREHPYPRLEVVRQARRDGARYFGPFTSSLAARETWKLLHKVFGLRRCTDKAMKNRVRPCLYHHLGQCPAPCAGGVDPAAYAERVRRIELLLAGKSRELLESLRQAMLAASKALKFEAAANLRDQIRAVEKTVERQAVVLPEPADLDVIGIVPVQSGLALGLLFVREGKLIDGRNFFWPGLGLEEGPELLFSFISQFYGPHTAVPSRLIIPWWPVEGDEDGADLVEVAGRDAQAVAALEAVLSAWKSGEDARDVVRVNLPGNAAERSLVGMAEANAAEAAKRRADVMPQKLAALFDLPGSVTRIECVDVSHTGGASAKVGMVVFEDGKAVRDAYRVYNIETGGDDAAALAAWARRRMESGPPWPDLALIDGGKNQIAAVVRALRDAGQADLFFVAGIAKARNEQGRPDRRAGNAADRIFVPNRVNSLPLREGSAELLFLQLVRDTAHRFALTRHRRARSKAALTGDLLRLPGVGAHTARLLWDHFQDMETMLAATPEALAVLPGIGKARAQALAARLKTLRGGVEP
jgi:excinuclease ABC subunit C